MKDVLLTSSVLIGAIVLLRVLFRRTITRRVQYALWGLVLLRLLIPVNLPAVEHNVLSAAEQTEVVQNYEALRGIDSIEHSHNGSVQGFPRYELMPERPVIVAEDVTPERFERMKTTVQVRNVLEPLWMIGIVAMGFALLLSNSHFADHLRKTRVPLEGVESKYPVYLCDDIPSPCLFGLFRPAIYVTSEAAKDANRLRYVIAHEETHARCLDPLWSLLRGLCLVIYWFDPLAWLAAYVSKQDCELACDEGVLARLGEAERVPYGETLLALVPVRRGGNPLLSATTMTAGKRQMKDRIQRIAEHKRPVAIALLAALTLTGIACAATFTGAKPPEAEPASAPLMEEALDPTTYEGFLAALEQTNCIRFFMPSISSVAYPEPITDSDLLESARRLLRSSIEPAEDAPDLTESNLFEKNGFRLEDPNIAYYDYKDCLVAVKWRSDGMAEKEAVIGRVLSNDLLTQLRSVATRQQRRNGEVLEAMRGLTADDIVELRDVSAATQEEHADLARAMAEASYVRVVSTAELEQHIFESPHWWMTVCLLPENGSTYFQLDVSAWEQDVVRVEYHKDGDMRAAYVGSEELYWLVRRKNDNRIGFDAPYNALPAIQNELYERSIASWASANALIYDQTLTGFALV